MAVECFLVFVWHVSECMWHDETLTLQLRWKTLTIYWICWTLEFSFFQMTVYCRINSDLPLSAAEFKEMPYRIDEIYFQKTGC